MANIDYYFMTLSPWCYVAGLRLEEVAAKHGAQITYKPVNLPKVFEATGGQMPKDRHPNRQRFRLDEMRRVSAKLGMPLNLKPAHWPTNGAPSCYAIIAAQEAGGGDLGGLTHALLRACWTEEKDIAEDSVIRAALEAHGFDAGLADTGMLQGAEVFERNTEEAIARGAFGAPTYMVDDELFWGQDRIEYLDDYLAAR